MKLAPCPACSNPVSSAAAACPKCGQPVRRAGLAGKLVQGFGLAAMCRGVVGSMGAVAVHATGTAAVFFLLGFVGFIAVIVGRFLD